MPLLRTCCLRALERDGYLFTLAATLIDHACRFLLCLCPCPRCAVVVAVAVYYPTQFVACCGVAAFVLIVGAAAAPSAPHSFYNYNNCLQ